MERISGVYEIVNTITGDFYIGSSNDLKRRKKEHFCEYYWKRESNKPLYKDMKQYGKEKFLFKTIQLCDPEELKKYEQLAIEKYKPKYNVCAAYTGLSKEDQKQYQKQYHKKNADKIKQYQKQYKKENADEIKQYQKQYNKQYRKQQCLYENELLTLCALRNRFARQGIEHPTLEAKKYLIK